MSVTVPLNILITDPKIIEDEALKVQLDSLVKQGHTILIDNTLLKYDFIAGPNCWFFRPDVAKLFDLAIKNARKIVHADQTRAIKQTTKKNAPRKPRAARKPRQGSPQVEGARETDIPVGIETGADLGADSTGTGG